MQYKVTNGEHQFELSVQDVLNLDWIQVGKNSYHLLHEGQNYKLDMLDVDINTKQVELMLNGSKFSVEISDKLDQLIEKLGMDQLADHAQKDVKAPMPGLILDILVSEGQTVSKDEDLLILEAMKMENILKADGEGTIKSIQVSKGDSVEKNQVLIELE